MEVYPGWIYKKLGYPNTYFVCIYLCGKSGKAYIGMLNLNRFECWDTYQILAEHPLGDDKNTSSYEIGNSPFIEENASFEEKYLILPAKNKKSSGNNPIFSEEKYIPPKSFMEETSDDILAAKNKKVAKMMSNKIAKEKKKCKPKKEVVQHDEFEFLDI